MKDHKHSSPTYSVNTHSFNIICVYTYHCLQLRTLCYSTALTCRPCRYGSTGGKTVRVYDCEYGHVNSCVAEPKLSPYQEHISPDMWLLPTLNRV